MVYKYAINSQNWTELSFNAYIDDDISFIPDEHYNGSASLTFRGWDGTSESNDDAFRMIGLMYGNFHL